MSKKIYVGNLSYSITDARLGEIFGAFGAVESAKVVLDKMSGRSKGFGFVEMTNDDEATNAIQQLNGHEEEGRALNVAEARPQSSSDGYGRSGGGGGHSRGGGHYGGGGGGGGGGRRSGGGGGGGGDRRGGSRGGGGGGRW